MASKNKPYEQFGPFILFKKVDSDALSELWRAAKIDGAQLGEPVALRRFTGGNREAMAAAAQAAQPIVQQLEGVSFVRHQQLEVVVGVAALVHEYAGGRSLRHILDRARGGNGTTPNPIPLDQAIVIAEKVALSVATTADLRHGGERLTHGALIPQFIWISDDGEIRVAGQQLGRGLVASLADPKVAAEIGRYFPPEYHASAAAAKSTDVYSLGAILFALLTGQEPPDATNASAFAMTIGGARNMSGTPLADDLRQVLQRSLTLDPASRYATIAEMKQDLSALVHGGKYSATTFNLAFYLSNLLKKEMESEALDRDKESKLNLAPYLEVAPVAPAPAPGGVRDTAPMFAAAAPAPPRRKPIALVAVAAGVIAVAAGVGVVMMGKKPAPAAVTSTATLASSLPVAPARTPQQVLGDSVVLSGNSSTATAPASATVGAADPEAQKKAFEKAVQQQLEAQMLSLQSEYNRKLQKEQSKNAPVAAAPAPAPAVVPASNDDHAAPSAAQLDAARRETRNDTPSLPPVQQTQSAAPAVVQQQTPSVAQQQQSVPPPQPLAAAVREGDVVDVLNLDTVPVAVRITKPNYPAMAAQQRVEATIILTALVSETGEVTDVRVLRGDKRFGLQDSAIRALRATRFSPAMKDGKRVKTWLPRTFVFKP